MSQSNELIPEVMRLDEVLKKIEHWRNNKESYSGKAIPDKLWRSIFKLEQDYSAVVLRRIFSLNTQQYIKKHDELIPKVHEEPPSDEDIKNTAEPAQSWSFAEVSIRHESDAAIQSLTPTAAQVPKETINADSKNQDQNDVAVDKEVMHLTEASVIPTSVDNIPMLTEAADKAKKAVSKLKSPDNSPQQYLDPSTIIVEYIRPDGHRLKIHTTTKSLGLVMQEFSTQEQS